MKTMNTLLIILLSFASISIQCQKKETGNNLVVFATDVNKPVCIAHAGDSRLFVADQTGYIYIIDSQGVVYPQPFLDIHERVTYGGERGLLGLAFHPQYADNGYFYVNYTGEEDSTNISRFSVNAGNPDLADPQSEFNILTIFQPYTNHNGGDLHFGPDGFLYIGMGDGGSAGDPGDRAQDLTEYLGKMLRIDINQGNPYSSPASNPFFNEVAALDEIWALGLRNPWRFSFDRVTGDLWIADVGQNAFEEIDFQPAASTGGENYGWRCYEAFQEYNSGGCPSPSAFVFPVHAYPHNPECSVTGGYVYRGNSSSPFYGYYFFADYCSDRIWTLHNEGGGWIAEEYGQFPGNNFSTFGEDVSGQLYIAGLSSGTIFRVIENSTDVSDPESEPRVSVFKSPSSSLIRIISGGHDTSARHISLIDLNGHEVLKTSTKQADYYLDAGKLVKGVYVIKIVIDGMTWVDKLVLGE